MLIKICGVTDPDQAVACALAGADAIGINLWPGSRRAVSVAQGQAIAAALRAAAGQVLRVGVFVNPPASLVQEALDWLDIAQLHGDEAPAVGAAVPGRVWKGLRLSGEADLAALAGYAQPAWPLIVLDAPSAGYGGSGQRLDPGLAARAAAQRPVLLAGGLTPANVGAAVAAVRPAGVDVASGVESAPGRKDLALVRDFIAAARRQTRSL